MADPFVGEIRAFPYTYAPVDWAFCWGQQVTINQFIELFAVIGNAYGGNGTTVFKLPSLVESSSSEMINPPGRVAMGYGSSSVCSPYAIGDACGEPTVTLTASTLAQHRHAMQGAFCASTENSPTSTAYLTRTIYQSNYSKTYTNINTQMGEKVISTVGGTQAHYNVQPVQRMSFCISLKGIFPIRP